MGDGGGLYDDDGPTVWPVCSVCKTTWVLRRALTFPRSLGNVSTRWIWQRDCKHKSAEGVIVSRDEAEATS